MHFHYNRKSEENMFYLILKVFLFFLGIGIFNMLPGDTDAPKFREAPSKQRKPSEEF